MNFKYDPKQFRGSKEAFQKGRSQGKRKATRIIVWAVLIVVAVCTAAFIDEFFQW